MEEDVWIINLRVKSGKFLYHDDISYHQEIIRHFVKIAHINLRSNFYFRFRSFSFKIFGKHLEVFCRIHVD